MGGQKVRLCKETVTAPKFAWRDSGRPPKSQSREPVSLSRIEPCLSWV